MYGSPLLPAFQSRLDLIGRNCQWQVNEKQNLKIDGGNRGIKKTYCDMIQATINSGVFSGKES
jgi:hypothetical protein